MLSTFYSAFSPVAFTVLGLWLVVVQTRHSDWSGSAEHRRRAYAVSLHFALPGLMSLLSLVDPNSKAMWKVTLKRQTGDSPSTTQIDLRATRSHRGNPQFAPRRG